jgi:hypothetical protein
MSTRGSSRRREPPSRQLRRLIRSQPRRKSRILLSCRDGQACRRYPRHYQFLDQGINQLRKNERQY